MSAKSQTPPPAYFLSLSLENVRSFGKKQTISFARPDGRPAQWTIILGDNGVGKTTVLKALAAIMPDDLPLPEFPSHPLNYNPKFFKYAVTKWMPSRLPGSIQGRMFCSFLKGKLNEFSKGKYPSVITQC